MLKKYQLSLLSAHSGNAAVDLFQTHTDDIKLVIMDVSMPDLNGFEVMGLMRHRNVNTPIILMSSRPAYANMKPKAFESPTAFIRKPFDCAELYSVIEACI